MQRGEVRLGDRLRLRRCATEGASPLNIISIRRSMVWGMNAAVLSKIPSSRSPIFPFLSSRHGCPSFRPMYIQSNIALPRRAVSILSAGTLSQPRQQGAWGGGCISQVHVLAGQARSLRCAFIQSMLKISPLTPGVTKYAECGLVLSTKTRRSPRHGSLSFRILLDFYWISEAHSGGALAWLKAEAGFCK
ncbi:hypothetical protein BCR34DRAFT_387575 [Clohesyomyces aquaticus]|uniref:Uncharacterized protein n=1 Tax=Clohesyomyces aquaticus TaxID=1231657 RepID=A0A1Y1ZF53_9PLEO|nr:hypothetical protein BCR34DRAFT_387575 [Clohesyomyces aquaticus]